MTAWWRTARASLRLELQRLARARLFLVFVLLQGVTFLLVVSLFALTGSRAPTALVDLDRGDLAQRLVQALRDAHRSFDLRPMSGAEAQSQLREGRLVAAITIPEGFTRAVEAGQTVPLRVDVDNVDVDLTDDIQRALPPAIVAFGRDLQLPAIRVAVSEHDLVGHDTDYIPYLTVSALALDAFVLAAVMGATAMAREWEEGTVRLWRLAPVSPVALLAGKLAASAIAATAALGVTALLVVFVYGVHPAAPLEVAAALLACVVIATCAGAWLGTALRRTLPVVPLIFGLAMPFYIDSGALEPARFDGDVIWVLAHASPIYYAVGVLEWAFHRLQVTPESVTVDMLVLTGLAVASVVAARAALLRGRPR